MQHMNSSEEQYSYRMYEGDPSPRQRLDNTYDDDFVEALAQRIVQRSTSEGQGHRMHPGLQLALAIVSVVVLIPLAAILVDGTKGF
jgi:hypothetical protein